jgi:hypothetical protein
MMVTLSVVNPRFPLGTAERYLDAFIPCIIEQEEVVKKILKHVGLWEVKSRPPPKIHSPPGDLHTDYSNSQIPPWDDGQTSPSRTPPRRLKYLTLRCVGYVIIQ